MHEGNFIHLPFISLSLALGVCLTGTVHLHPQWVLQVYLTADVPHMYYDCTTWVQYTLTGTKSAFHRVISEKKTKYLIQF